MSPVVILVVVAVVALGTSLATSAKSPGLGALVAAVNGLAVSGYLALHHRAAEGSKLCDVSDTISCDAVSRSPYAELLGAPIAVYGIGLYAAVAWVAWRAWRESRPGASALVFLAGAVAVAFDGYLAWAMTQVGAICPFCVLTWVLNVIVLVDGARLLRASPGGPGAAMNLGLKDELPLGVAVGLGAFLVSVLAFRAEAGATAAATGGSARAVDIASYAVQPRGPITLGGSEPMKGDPNARFTIVEWADYQCPHCALMAEALPKVLEKNKDLKLLFKHYPISGICNELIDGERHPFACGAAFAAECARQQGRFFELSDAMFKNQEYLSSADIRFIAQQKQLDMAAFDACVAAPETTTTVKKDIAHASTAMIDGTPSVFIKGAWGDSWVHLAIGADEAEAVIGAILEAARAGKPLPSPRPPEPLE
jgi:protein-disulfide isomerase/uncharacterized membrane protein